MDLSDEMTDKSVSLCSVEYILCLKTTTYKTVKAM